MGISVGTPRFMAMLQFQTVCLGLFRLDLTRQDGALERIPPWAWITIPVLFQTVGGRAGSRAPNLRWLLQGRRRAQPAVRAPASVSFWHSKYIGQLDNKLDVRPFNISQGDIQRSTIPTFLH